MKTTLLLQGCVPYSLAACRAALKWEPGFENAQVTVGDYAWTKGCYLYTGGSNKGKAFYGRGTLADKKRALTSPKSRPVGHDCQEGPSKSLDGDITSVLYSGYFFKGLRESKSIQIGGRGTCGTACYINKDRKIYNQGSPFSIHLTA